MKKTSLILSLIVLLLLTGCTPKINLDITENSQAIVSRNDNTYYNPKDVEDTYCFVEINGEKYLPFGTQDGRLTGDIIGECIAYEKDDRSERYYEVIGHKEFVAAYYISGVMEQWEFFRSEKTLGKEIETPDFIYDFGYDIWK